MTPFELYYRRFERLPQIQQLSITFNPTIEEVFETLDKTYIHTTSSHSIIETIVNQISCNTFQHHNGPNQLQHTYKNTSQHHQHINTSQKYQHIPRTLSIPYLK